MQERYEGMALLLVLRRKRSKAYVKNAGLGIQRIHFVDKGDGRSFV